MRSIIVGLLCLIVGGAGAWAYEHYLGDGKQLADSQAQVAALQDQLTKANADTAKAKTETQALTDQVQQLSASKDDLQKQLDAAKSAATTTAAAPAPPRNPFASPMMVNIMKATFKQRQTQRLEMLKARLHLTDEQVQQVQAALDAEDKAGEEMAAKFLSGQKIDMQAAKDLQSMKSLDQTLNDILTPDQKTEYQQVKTDERNSAAETAASYQMNQVSSLLNLNDTQKDQVESALYQAQLNSQDPNWLKANAGNSADPVSIAQAQEQAKEDALSKILTPDQMALYKQQAQSQLQMQKAMIQNFSPNAAGGSSAPSPAPPPAPAQ